MKARPRPGGNPQRETTLDEYSNLCDNRKNVRERSLPMARLIFHVDVNSAFLSWEAARRVANGEEDIRRIPSAIGGDRDKRTGVVLPCSPTRNGSGHGGWTKPMMPSTAGSAGQPSCAVPACSPSWRWERNTVRRWSRRTKQNKAQGRYGIPGKP